MRFMILLKVDKYSEAGVPPSQELMAEMGKFIQEMVKAGVLLAAEGLHPSSKGARLRFSGGKHTVADGPFTEAKEAIDGFALIQVKSKAEAIEWASRFARVVGDVELGGLGQGPSTLATGQLNSALGAKSMIESAEEFARLRSKHIQAEYYRSGHESAFLEVWLEVLANDPDTHEWVAHNKTVPLEDLSIRAHDNDRRVHPLDGHTVCNYHTQPLRRRRHASPTLSVL